MDHTTEAQMVIEALQDVTVIGVVSLVSGIPTLEVLQITLDIKEDYDDE